MVEVYKGSREDIPEELKPAPDLEPLEVVKDPPLESTKKIGDQEIQEAPDETPIGEEDDIEDDKTSQKNESSPDKDKATQERDAQKAYWRDKYLKLKGEKNPPKEVDEDIWKAKVNFLLTHKDVSEEEFDHIATVAASKEISLSEAAEQEKDYFDFRRKKVAEDNKTPAPSSSSFETKSSEDIAKMSKEDHKKLDEEFARKQKTGRAGI